jgi:Uncharacterized protein conserved in bacteria (DUF2059)
MHLRPLAVAVVLGLAGPGQLLIPTPALADTTAKPAPAEVSVAALTQALQLERLFGVLRDEGLAYGDTLEADMFPGGGGPQWRGAVTGIYDTAALRQRFEAVLQDELGADQANLAAILAFFTSDLGQRVVGLEIDARAAFLDKATEEAARVAADKRQTGRDPLQPLLADFIETGDLIEMNVAGSLSSNLAFLTGMADTGLYGDDMPQDMLMSQVWGQEDQIRTDITSWLYAYLGLAYSPLTSDEMQDYVTFMESPAGKRLNAALFVAYDRVFRQVSFDLGVAAGRAIQGSDI